MLTILHKRVLADGDIELHSGEGNENRPLAMRPNNSSRFVLKNGGYPACGRNNRMLGPDLLASWFVR